MAGAVDALKVVDRALDRVHMERAKFGALMSRMNVVIDNLTTISQSQELLNQEYLMLILQKNLQDLLSLRFFNNQQ